MGTPQTHGTKIVSSSGIRVFNQNMPTSALKISATLNRTQSRQIR